MLFSGEFNESVIRYGGKLKTYDCAIARHWGRYSLVVWKNDLSIEIEADIDSSSCRSQFANYILSEYPIR